MPGNIGGGMEQDQFLIIGHRGIPELDLENSLNGFFQIGSQNLGAVEFDIQLTKDLVPVVFHDDDFSRLCGVDGVLKETLYRDLPLLGNGQAIPRLGDVLVALGNKPVVHAEIKAEHGFDVILRHAQPFIRPGFIFSSFHLWAVEFFKNHNQQTLSLFDKNTTSFVTQQIQDHIFARKKEDTSPIGFHKSFILEAKRNLRTCDLLNSLRARNISFYIYTINMLDEALAAKSSGANGLYSDAPLFLRQELTAHPQIKQVGSYDLF